MCLSVCLAGAGRSGYAATCAASATAGGAGPPHQLLALQSHAVHHRHRAPTTYGLCHCLASLARSLLAEPSGASSSQPSTTFAAAAPSPLLYLRRASPISFPPPPSAICCRCGPLRPLHATAGYLHGSLCAPCACSHSSPINHSYSSYMCLSLPGMPEHALRNGAVNRLAI